MNEVTRRDDPLPGAELRERRRRRMAASIERAALELFAARGFANVTVTEIAAAVDISRRTFFRYFTSKEAVLFGEPDREEERLVQALTDRPADEGPVEALHAALVEVALEHEADVTITRLRLEVLEQAPDITAAAFQQRISFQRRVTPLVAERMHVDETRDMRPALVVTVSMSAMYVGMWQWLTNGAVEPLHDFVSQALRYAADGLTTATAAVPC